MEQFNYIIPTFKEILDDKFNYPMFVENCTDDIIAFSKGIKQGIFKEIDEEMDVYDLRNINSEPEEKALSEKYTSIVNEVVQKYRNDLVNNNVTGDVYTIEMKKIANDYLAAEEELLKTKISLANLQEEIEKLCDNLYIVMLHKDAEIRKINEGSKDRVISYLNGDANLRDLYIDDLSIRIDGKQSPKLMKIKRLICACLPSSFIGDRRLNTLTIGKLEPFMSRLRK